MASCYCAISSMHPMLLKRQEKYSVQEEMSHPKTQIWTKVQYNDLIPCVNRVGHEDADIRKHDERYQN